MGKRESLPRGGFGEAVEGVERMAQWQALALGTKPKKPAAEYMDLHFLNQVLDELKRK